jgi:hypothetical protein
MKTYLQMLTLLALLITSRGLFAQTNAPDAPLPLLDALVTRVIEQAQKESKMDHDFKQHYSYKRTRVTEYHSADGALDSHEEKSSDKHPRVFALTNPPTSLTISNSVPPEAKFGKSDLALLDRDLVNRFHLTLVGRKLVNGRPALVVDFKPKSGELPEKNIKDRFINHAAGRIWIDEADAALSQANVHLTQKISVFGGLAGAVWKFNGTLQRERTDDGLWHLHDFSWHLEGREVLENKIVDFHEQWLNVVKTR